MTSPSSTIPRHVAARCAQSGAVLVVALVLLLLAAVMTAFAMNVGVFEQRSTGNDLRAREVNDVAEAGLAQGFEYLMRQHPDMFDNAALWEPCAATDTTFPCGAISDALFDDDGDPTTAKVSRRETMYRLKANNANTITGIDPALSKYMLPLASGSKIGTAQGDTVAYGVAPVVCFAARPTFPGAEGIRCGNGTGATATTMRIVTFASVARVPGESASTTLVQTIGQYPKLGEDISRRPTITASGVLDVTGTLQIVTNPNAAGPGVPVSLWTRLDVDKHGTTNTCYADEFFRYTQGSANPVPYDGTIRCDNCSCDVNAAPRSLSYDASGRDRCTSPTDDCEGMDVLDVDTGTNSTAGYNVGGHKGANYNVRSDALSYPLCEFPPDLFFYVFGTRSWQDNDHDCFAETKMANVLYQNPDNASATASVGPDEAYLYKNADKVIAKAANAALLKAGQAGDRSLLTSSASHGMIWCQQETAGDCDIESGDQVGTPSAPVILILDGPVQIQGVVFGIVFIRDTGTTLHPETGSSVAGACPSNCMLQMNAGSAIYGALVLQGQMKSNGTSAVIHDDTVLGTVNEQAGLTYATLPGAWTDRRVY
jgi:hypothetical protein